jgi:hypothetical protein
MKKKKGCEIEEGIVDELFDIRVKGNENLVEGIKNKYLTHLTNRHLRN